MAKDKAKDDKEKKKESATKQDEKSEKGASASTDSSSDKRDKKETDKKKKSAKPDEEKKKEKPLEGEDTDEKTKEGEDEEGRGFTFYVMIGLGSIIVLCIGLFVFALLIALFGGGSGDAAAFISIIRDLFIIFLVLQGMIICIALIIMILQLSALMNVLDNEIKPIVQNIQETTSTLRGTAEFVSTNVTKPVIRAHAFVTGALSIMREISGIRNALRQTSQNLEDSPLKVTEANPKPETKETKETPVKEEVKETPTPKVDKSEEQKNGETKSD